MNIKPADYFYNATQSAYAKIKSLRKIGLYGIGSPLIAVTILLVCACSIIHVQLVRAQVSY